MNRYAIIIKGNDVFEISFGNIKCDSFQEAYAKAVNLLEAVQPQTIEKLRIANIIEVEVNLT